MKVDADRKQLVRGYVVYSQWRAGCISMERAKDDDVVDVGVAYTPWHRHDEDPALVEKELDQLCKFYMDFAEVEGAMMGFEYKDYRR